ncbi:MAG: methylmalonyl Co-A mutase-associated GTPase MeaB [Bdellovibrionales bacterium]|nr:methylmalonyl Co-A mutase-associated GTPase MeaB [Bdellovibrionales bacterium]
MSDPVKPLLSASNFLQFARLLTAIENFGPRSLQYEVLLNPQKMACRIGITGPPGAGKSTLVGGLIQSLRAHNLSVGVIAVDPSSPFSKGAILGDRIRYSEHFSDDKVFIRSLGTRGSLGGLSASAYLMLRAFDHYGFDVVLVETVGVGQTELEVINVADFTTVVLVPESGDSIQAMKAGLLEIADLYVVNKADRPGAHSLVNEIKANLELGANHNATGLTPSVLTTVATENKGVADLASHFLNAMKTADFKKRRHSPRRLQAEATALLRANLENKIELLSSNIQTTEDLKNLLLSEN